MRSDLPEADHGVTTAGVGPRVLALELLRDADMAMYEATSDRRYLDTLVAHVDRILAGAADDDGDGYLGWGCYRYSEDEIPNGGFEEARCTARVGNLCVSRDRKTPEHWVRWQSSVSTALRTSLAKRTDKMGVRLVTRPPTWQVIECRPWGSGNFSYDPGKWYRLSWAARTNGKVGASVQVYDFTARKMLASRVTTSTSWGVSVIDFRAPAAGHDIAVRLMPSDPSAVGGYVDFDDIGLQQKLEWLVHDGMIAWPIARFIAEVRSDLALKGYRSKADAYLTFITSQILPKWQPHYRKIFGGTAGTYVFPPDPSYEWHGNSLPHNMYLALGRVYLWLYRATGSSAYRLRARELGAWFLRNLRQNPKDPSAYTWRYFDPIPGDRFKAGEPEDLSHANIDVGFAVLAARSGVLFNDSHLARMASTLTKVMWNRSWDEPRLTQDVEGGGDDSYSIYLPSWAQLARRVRATSPLKVWDLVRAVQDDLRCCHKPTQMQAAAELLASLPFVGGGLSRPDLDDGTLPSGWRRWQSTAATAYRDTGLYGMGARLDSNGQSWQVLEYPLLHYPAATPAFLSAWARGDAHVGARVQVLDMVSRHVLAERTIVGEQWRPVCMSWMTPANSGRDLRIRLLHDDWKSKIGQARFDDLKLDFSPLANGGFEARSYRDPGLPSGWRRWQSKPSTVRLCTGCQTQGSFSIRLDTDPARGWQVLEQRLAGYRAGQQYAVSFAGRTNGPVGCMVTVVDFSSSPPQTLGSASVTSGSWQYATVSFQAPATLDRDIRVRLRHMQWNLVGTAWFDDMKITPFGCSTCPPRNIRYGTGKLGSLGWPRLDSTTAPVLGASWRLGLSRALPSAIGQLLVGRTSLAFPFDGGQILVKPDLALPVKISSVGKASLQFSLPSSPSLCGSDVFWQVWIPNDPVASGQGWAASNGLRIHIGR